MKQYVYRIHIRPESAITQNPFNFCKDKNILDTCKRLKRERA